MSEHSEFAFIKLCDQALPPRAATAGSAGYDIASCEDTVIPAGEWRAIDTGLALRFPVYAYARVAPRSGLAYRHGINVLAGVIDSDYRKAVKVILINHGTEDFLVHVGDRIAQIIFQMIYPPSGRPLPEILNPVPESGEVHEGFGSTGMR